MKLNNIKKAYLIGIKGTGMTALAQVLKERGIKVIGTDVSDVFPTDRVLVDLNIEVEQDFKTEHLNKTCDLVIRSTAYNEDHAAVKKALDLGCPTKTYPEVLSELISTSYGLAVSGTHGKTTTTAMLGLTLVEMGLDPTVIVGSEVPQFKSNARVGHSDYLVVEADEYQNKFLDYKVKGAIITNVDYDHPDFFKTPKDYFATFGKFIEQLPKDGFLVYCAEDEKLVELTKQAKCQLISYGFKDGCDFQAKNLHYKEGKLHFKVFCHDNKSKDFYLQVPGEHNVLNALACIACAHKLSFDPEKMKSGLAGFQGTNRRFEHIDQYNGATIIDDFAHHPTEVKATLKAVRDFYPKKNIFCIFHPHTFSRTKALLHEFSKSFSEADQVVILDIFGSAREEQGGVHSKDLVNLIKEQGQEVHYVPTINEAAEWTRDKLGPSDVLITMGAGEAWQIGKMLIKPDNTRLDSRRL